MKNSKDLKFTPYNPCQDDYESPDGQLELTPFTPTSRGIKAAITARALQEIPEGDVVALHHDRLILWHGGDLYWCIPGEEPIHHICQASSPKCVSVTDHCIIIAHADALTYYYITDVGYTPLPQSPKAPVIEFGLQTKGQLNVSSAIILDSTVATDDPAAGSGASATHPVTGTDSADSGKSHQKIIEIYREATRIRAESHGLFCHPFLVRYGVRMHDGLYCYISPPVMMLPTVLPPCIGVHSISADSNGKVNTTLDLSACRMFELRARLAEGIGAEWRELIVAVDIFISPQVETFSDVSASGHISEYADIVSMAPGGRGREQQSDARVYIGTYSEGNDQYSEQYLSGDDLRRRAWSAPPNTHLCSALLNNGDFYRVASLSLEQLDAMTTFRTITIESTSESDLRKCRRLTDDDYGSITIRPETLHLYCDQLYGAGGSLQMDKPGDLRQLCARHCEADEPDSIETVITVYSKSGHRHSAVTATCRFSSHPLSEVFPRFLYYPDHNAYMMQISQGEEVYHLPLTPHEALDGAYWFGGLDCANIPPLCSEESTPPTCAEADGNIPAGNMIFVSEKGNHHIFRKARAVSIDSCNIISLRTSVKAPGTGQFGKFPLYVFTTSGVWLLDHDSASSAITSLRKISDARCNSAQAVVPTGAGVAFCSGSRLMHVAGSTVTQLLAGRYRSFNIAELPYAHLLPGASRCHTDVSLTHSRIHYLSDKNALILYRPGREGCIVYYMDSKLLSTTDIAIDSSIPGAADYIIAHHECMYRIAESDDDDVLLITRPMKLGGISTTDKIESVTVWTEDPRRQCIVALYGSDHIIDWRLIGSSRSHHLPVRTHRPYRFYRLAVTGPAGQVSVNSE